MAMLSEKTVTKRAIRWTVIAELAVIEGNHSASSFSKASAYMDVLNINWSGKGNTRENLQAYGKMIAEAYILDRMRDNMHNEQVTINEYMDNVVCTEKYKT